MTANLADRAKRVVKSMNIEETDALQSYSSKEPDEGWWAAVLADEPQLDEEETPAEPTDIVVEPVIESEIYEDEPRHPSIDWENVQRLFSKDEIVHLRVVGHNRGGILVSGDHIQGFVPASHLIDLPADLQDREREQYLCSYFEREIALKVIECNPKKERIVFSERAALAKEGQRKYLLNNLMEGDIVEGTVTNVTSFGAFVDLGGLEGLIHVSELSWGRVNDPSDFVNVDERVSAMVLDISEDQGRIALSLKRLEDNPWETLVEKCSPGDVVDAVIASIVKYGAFARLPEGVDGLIHVSSMNFPDGCSRIEDFLCEGQKVRVCILNIDPQKRRLGLRLESA